MLHSSTFWLAISMAIFVALVYRPLTSFTRSTLDKRRETIRSDLAEAERLRAEAQDLLSTCQRQHREAVQEAESIIAAARMEADRLRTEAAASLKELITAREAAALAKIAQEEANATRAARDMAAQLALAASAEILRQKLSGTQADALIDKAISELPQQLAS